MCKRKKRALCEFDKLPEPHLLLRDQVNEIHMEISCRAKGPHVFING
jgi:hypothetical protein